MRLTMSRRMTTRIKVGALAVAAATTGAVLAPTPAYANTNRVEIVNVSTSLRADVIGASTAAGQGAFLWPNNASGSQEFDLINMGAGYFQIRARHSFKCLMLDKTATKVGDGTRVAQYPCPDAGYKSAQWSFQDMNGGCPDTALCVDTGRRIVKNRYTGRCLEAANSSGKKPPKESVLQIWTCISSPRAWNADNQIWKLYDPVARRNVTQPS